MLAHLCLSHGDFVERSLKAATPPPFALWDLEKKENLDEIGI